MQPVPFPSYTRLRDCRYGQMLFNVHDAYIGRSLDIYGEFSEGEVELFRQVVQPGDVVLDVGANLGAHTVFFARQVGPGGAVLAFEPQRLVFQLLCANLALNNLTNVLTYQAALGTQPGQVIVPLLDFHQANNFGGLGLGSYTDGEAVPVLTIDSLGLARCKLLKIDVEGMEEQVLRGAAETIARLRPLLYVENDRLEKSASLIAQIDSLGYRLFIHEPPLYHPNNFFHNPENVFGNIVSKNLFCVHGSVASQISGMTELKVQRTAGA